MNTRNVRHVLFAAAVSALGLTAACNCSEPIGGYSAYDVVCVRNGDTAVIEVYPTMADMGDTPLTATLKAGETSDQLGITVHSVEKFSEGWYVVKWRLLETGSEKNDQTTDCHR